MPDRFEFARHILDPHRIPNVITEQKAVTAYVLIGLDQFQHDLVRDEDRFVYAVIRVEQHSSEIIEMLLGPLRPLIADNWRELALSRTIRRALIWYFFFFPIASKPARELRSGCHLYAVQKMCSAKSPIRLFAVRKISRLRSSA